MELQDAIVALITQPIRRQERQDTLIEQIFKLDVDGKSRQEIASFFKLIGPRIAHLSKRSIDVIMRLLYYLELDADRETSIEAKADLDSFHDIDWNREISNILIKKLREAYAVLGIPEQESSPGELVQQGQAISAYVQTERMELEKSANDNSYIRSQKQITRGTQR